MMHMTSSPKYTNLSIRSDFMIALDQATTTLLAVTLVLDYHKLYELTWSQATC